MQRRLAILLAAMTLAIPALGQEDLSDYRTVDKAITTKIGKLGKGPALAGYLGITVKKDGAALVIDEVQPASPGGKAGLLPGDRLMGIDGFKIASADSLREFLQSKGPGAAIRVSIQRDKKAEDIAVTLAATSRPITATGGGGTVVKGKKGTFKGPVDLPLWKKSQYRLAVVVIEYPDFKSDAKAENWDEAFFSKNTYLKTNATGQAVHGSLNDYFLEQSHGKFHIEGKAFAPVLVSKKRGEYALGSGTTNKTGPLSEALALLAKRDGDDVLQGFDGIAFLYSGPRVLTNRGNLYYPHRGSVTFKNKSFPYILCPAGGKSMESIGTFALEFGKLLGLPELAARTDNPGSEGLGVWCLMSNGAGTSGKPSHLCAWCKEQLGWLTPAVIDPAVKQKLILAATQTSAKECVKVLVRADGSEYFLLENRVAKGFDRDLPGQGMLIWRVINNRPILEESHGVAGPTGPRVLLSSVPFPSKSNGSFTPATTPSSRSLAGGGLPVHITNIRRLPDGRITFFVGYEAY